MPFGFFQAEKKNIPSAPPKARMREPVPAAPPAPSPEVRHVAGRLRILLVGRNLPIIQEYLSAMSLNLGTALSSQGMACYTQELDTIACVTAVKKKLEQHLWTFSQADWAYPEDNATSADYVFSISPSANQNQALDLAFHCITPADGANINYEGFDAIWLLSDGAIFLDTENPYLVWLQEFLAALSHLTGQKPVCLIQTQIECIAHFDGVGNLSDLPQKQAEKIASACRGRFAAPAAAALIPVQSYGGMACVGVDERQNPVLRIGQSGYYQTYLPDNCQIPLFYTVQAIHDYGKVDFLSNSTGVSLLSAIERHYGEKFGTNEWKPATLNGEEAS